MKGHAMEHLDAREWWESRRPRYTRTVAGACAISMFAFLFVECACFPAGDFTLLWVAALPIKIAVGAALVGAAVGLANLAYFLGPLLERVVRPVEPACFRERWYRIGTFLSVAVPTAAPIVVGVLALLRPEWWE